MKYGIGLALLALILIIGAGVTFGFSKNRPTALSIAIRSSTAYPAAMRGILNGVAILESSIRGRSQTGGLYYQSTFGANLSVQMMWYDIINEKFYGKSFELDARRLSTFGEDAIHASLKIVVGPGADITVTTPHPEGWRLVGLNRMDDITPEMDIPVVLFKLCADLLGEDPSEGGVLTRAMSDDISMASAMEKRERWLKSNSLPTPRCAKENENDNTRFSTVYKRGGCRRGRHVFG